MCTNCKYKVACAMLSKYTPIPLLIECNLITECNRVNKILANKINTVSIFNVKDGAKILKKVLQYKYPQYKWSVLGKHFANGNSIDAYYKDPNYFYKDAEGKYIDNNYTEVMRAEDDVIQSICNQFQEGHFDGMSDMYEYDDKVLGCTKYCSAHRKQIDYPY